jgi:hypothetical protein
MVRGSFPKNLPSAIGDCRKDEDVRFLTMIGVGLIDSVGETD